MCVAEYDATMCHMYSRLLMLDEESRHTSCQELRWSDNGFNHTFFWGDEGYLGG